MGELSKIIAGLDDLTPDETAELSRLLARRGYASEPRIVDEEEAEVWLVAELIALQREAQRLAASLDETHAYSSARYAALMSGT